MPSQIRSVLVLLALVATASGSTPRAQSGPFVLPEDLEISLWAESPMFFNPTNIDVDARGRVWVAEAVNYRGFNTAKQAPLTHPAGDRILILTDRNGDGRADSAKVFVQDKDLRAPLGLAVVGNRVVVSSSPHLIVYTDENGDDTPDKKEILLTGFGGVRSRPRPARARRRTRRTLVLQHRQRRPAYRHRSLGLDASRGQPVHGRHAIQPEEPGRHDRATMGASGREGLACGSTLTESA